MIEITGSIFNSASWSHQPNTPKIALGITTNGIVKSNGLAVMGAGVAKAFVRRYPQLPDGFIHQLSWVSNEKSLDPYGL